MADYPTPSDYQEVLQVPEAAFEDTELQTATPRTNVLGLPQPITGGFAAVFPMTTESGRRFAVKCFLAEQPDQQTRYSAVADVLGEVDHEALLAFEYQPTGIHVDDTAYPLLKMEWAEGTVLNRFVEQHLDAPETLARLANAWVDLMSDLEGLDLAHGDLQHGNVLVDGKDEELHLRLVDYDTMYVPALEGWASAEVGHRNYQHPDRTDADFGPFLDRFAGLVIYTALRACAVQPDLWDRYDTGENLLFRDVDFYDPDQSPLLNDLAAMEATSDLAGALRTACYVEPADVPPLEAVREGQLEPSQWAVSRSRRRRRSRAREREPFARWFLPAVAVVCIVGIGLAVAGLPIVALVVLLGMGAVGGGMVVRQYRRLSIVRRRRRLEQEADRFAEAIRALEREVESLQEKRREMLDSIEERREKRLQELQEEALHECLKHHFIGEVREVEGLTHKHVVRLKAANVRTAYEATPDTIDDIRRISDEARAQLKLWRAALVQEYEDEVPDTLSPAEERRLQRYVQHRVEDIDATLARAREKIQVQEVERERVLDRLSEMPTFSVWRYLRYLLYLEQLPEQEERAPAPTFSEPPEGASASSPVPEPIEDDRSWWKRSK